MQVRINDRLVRTDNYSNYIQVLLRKYTSQVNPDEKNQFIPFSFTFNYIKRKDQSLIRCLKEFNKAEPTDYLEYKEIPRKIITWTFIGQVSLFLIVVIVIFILIIFAFISGNLQLPETISQGVIMPVIGSIVAGMIGFLFHFIKRRMSIKKREEEVSY